MSITTFFLSNAMLSFYIIYAYKYRERERKKERERERERERRLGLYNYAVLY